MHLVSPCALFQMVKAFGQHPGVAKSRCGHNSLICFVCVAGNGRRSSLWVWRVWILSPFFPCLWSHENGTVFYDFMSLVIGKTWKEQDQQGRTERTERRGSRFQFGVHYFRPISKRRTSIRITGICRNSVTGFKQLWLRFWFHTGRARVVT